jgi:hypothetical protein
VGSAIAKVTRFHPKSAPVSAPAVRSGSIGAAFHGSPDPHDAAPPIAAATASFDDDASA